MTYSNSSAFKFQVEEAPWTDLPAGTSANGRTTRTATGRFRYTLVGDLLTFEMHIGLSYNGNPTGDNYFINSVLPQHLWPKKEIKTIIRQNIIMWLRTTGELYFTWSTSLGSTELALSDANVSQLTYRTGDA